MLTQFDLISDTHVDFWVRIDSNLEKMTQRINDFAQSLLPDEPSNVLVIAGDLGHYNHQNILFLKALKNVYEYIFLVDGNHDYYMISKKIMDKYHNDSLNRPKEMKELIKEFEGVHYFDGTSIEVDGVVFGGTGMWYDYSFGMQTLMKSFSYLDDLWRDNMNDSKMIRGLPRRTMDMFWHEKEKLDKVIIDCDVIVTHVGPDWSRVIEKYRLDAMTSFYYFDGQDYFDKIDRKIWCWGHTHSHYSYMKNGCYFVNNSLGYPGEKAPSKIVNIPLESFY